MISSKLRPLNPSQKIKEIPGIDLKELGSADSVFTIRRRFPAPELDSLVRIEVALRRCERVGVFRK